MRFWVTGLAIVLAAGLAGARSGADEAKKYHKVDAEVVAADTEAMTITLSSSSPGR